VAQSAYPHRWKHIKVQQTARHGIRALESLGMNVSERSVFAAYYDPTLPWHVLLVLFVVASTIAIWR
jgi:hypothetical protein